MAGVGNLYKTEVCFLLGLSPWTLVRDVPDPAAAITRINVNGTAQNIEQCLPE